MYTPRRPVIRAFKLTPVVVPATGTELTFCAWNKLGSLTANDMWITTMLHPALIARPERVAYNGFWLTGDAIGTTYRWIREGCPRKR
jgi:hypothetical protein